MSRASVLFAIALVALVCVLAGAEPGWRGESTGLAAAETYRLPLFYVATAAAMLAAVLAEHGRRGSP